MNNKVEAMRKRLEGQIMLNKDWPDGKANDLKELIEEFKTTLEQLQVADEELRTQNEQLMAGHQALEDERQRYQDLFDFTPDAYLVTDPMGVVREANRAAQALFEIDYHFLIGKTLISLVSQEYRKHFRQMLGHTNPVSDTEMTFKRRMGPIFEAAVRIAQVKNPAGHLLGFRWLLRDITEQKQLAQKLRENQERIQKIFLHAMPGIALLKKNQEILDSNPSFQQLLQSTPDKLHNVNVIRFIHEEDQLEFAQQVHQLMDESVENVRFEVRFLRKDRSVCWGLVSLSTMLHTKEDEPNIILFVEEITTQKELAAERIEMQHRVIDSIESERAHLARELHDNPLQTLNGALFLLACVDEACLDDENKQKFKNVRSVLRDAADSLRHTCSELRSPSLNTFGLKKGVVAYLEKFTEINPEIDVNLYFEGNNNAVPERLSLALYRILQESISNVLRHARATQVDIRLKLFEDAITLRIADNGAGFTPPGSMVDFMRVGHYGLSGISERVEMIGGQLSIASAPGAGTIIEVTVDPRTT